MNRNMASTYKASITVSLYGDFSPPSFWRKPTSWTFCVDPHSKRCGWSWKQSNLWVSVRMIERFPWFFYAHIVLVVRPPGELMGLWSGLHLWNQATLARRWPSTYWGPGLSLTRLEGHARSYVEWHNKAAQTCKDEEGQVWKTDTFSES